MTIRKCILALTLAASALYASQASAVISSSRPSPNGMNGTSLTGRTDQAPSADRDAYDAATPKTVVLPDGTHLVVK
jgi:hypothetical protein